MNCELPILKTKKQKINEFCVSLAIATVLMTVFYAIQQLGIANLFNPNKINLPAVFIIGVMASLSSCMAVVGSLVLTISADFAKEKNRTPLVLFHASRLVSFFILGGVIGLLGKAFTLNPTANFALNLVLFFVMFINGMVLLDVFKSFRKFSFTMPSKALDFIDKRIQIKNVLTPLLLGTATFFLPCGFTQSMQVYSLTTKDFLMGGITMFVFALGTFPMLSLVSAASMTLSNNKYSGIFYKTAGFLIIFFGFLNLYGGLVSVGLLAPVFNF